jgi:hypothetical protein
MEEHLQPAYRAGTKPRDELREKTFGYPAQHLSNSFADVFADSKNIKNAAMLAAR